jgi:hypothetical protein
VIREEIEILTVTETQIIIRTENLVIILTTTEAPIITATKAEEAAILEIETEILIITEKEAAIITAIGHRDMGNEIITANAHRDMDRDREMKTENVLQDMVRGMITEKDSEKNHHLVLRKAMVMTNEGVAKKHIPNPMVKVVLPKERTNLMTDPANALTMIDFRTHHNANQNTILTKNQTPSQFV